MDVNATRGNIETGKKIKCVQINLGRGRRATNHLLEKIAREDIQIVFIQEPYVINNRVCGFPSRYKTFYYTQTQSHGDFQEDNDRKLRTAIVITDPNLKGITLADKSSDNFLVLEIQGKGINFLAISAYFPPEQRHPGEFQLNLRKFNNILTTLNVNADGNNRKVIVGLDANSKSGLWNSPVEDRRGRELENLISDFNYVVLNDNEQPTFVGHCGTSYIDFTMVNANMYANISDWKLDEDETLSDHKYIYIEIDTYAENAPPVEGRIGFCAKKADWTVFDRIMKESVAMLDTRLNREANNREIEAIAGELNIAVVRACEQAMPRKKSFKKSVPWWTPELTEMRKEVNRLRRSYQRCRDENVRRTRELEYKARFNAYKTALEDTRVRKWREFCTKSSGRDPWGLAYKVIRRKRVSAGGNVTIKNVDGEYTESAIETARTFLEVFFPDDNIDADSAEHTAIRENALLDINTGDDREFAACEIRAAFESMNPQKAPGIDGITADIALKAYEAVPHFFAKLFNLCLGRGVFPKCWKQQLVKVIPKSGKTDMTDAKSYRPISLIPVIGKALDSLIINRIEYHVYSAGYMNDAQFGFRKGRSTIDAIETVKDFIENAREEGDYCAAIMLDIRGAFDHAWWPLIIRQLKQKDCPRNLVKVAEAYFSEREAVIEEPGMTRVSRVISRGCPQGSRSGPGYWNILYDSIFEIGMPEGCRIVAFADDTALLVRARQYKALKTAADRALAEILSWAETNKLTFNGTKSEALFFGKKTGQQKPTFKLGGERIYCATEVKYLGVYLDEKLNFKHHIQYATAKAREITNKIGVAAKLTWGLSGKAAATIYTGAIEPSMLYAAPIWADACRVKESRKLLGVQRLSAVRATRAYKTTSTEAAATIAGMLPADIRARELRKRRFANKMSKENFVAATGIDAEPNRVEETVVTQARLHPAEIGTISFKKQIDVNERIGGVEIYTDGSRSEQGTGAAFVVYVGEEELYQERLRLANECDNYQAEVIAINAAAKYVREMRLSNATIITDSLSALEALKGMRRTTELLLETWEIIREHNINLVWTRAHVGTRGNERADELAKEAATADGQICYDKISRKSVKSAIANICEREWQARWENATNGQWTKKFIRDVKEFKSLGLRLSYQAIQLITGHGKFGAYLHRFGRRDNPSCDWCGEEDTASHVLFSCPETAEWRARTELDAIRKGLSWPTREDEINSNGTADWWRFFNAAAEKLQRLQHD